MQGTALLVREVVTVVVRDDADSHLFGHGGRLVENDSPFSTRLHWPTDSTAGFGKASPKRFADGRRVRRGRMWLLYGFRGHRASIRRARRGDVGARELVPAAHVASQPPNPPKVNLLNV